MSAPTAPKAESVEFNPFSETFFNNPYDTYRRLREEAPLYHNAEYGFWAISRYEDIAPAYKDSATFSSAKGVTLDMIKIAELLKGVPPQLIMLDPPEHDRMRRLVSKAFTPRAVKAWADLVTETIHGSHGRTPRCGSGERKGASVSTMIRSFGTSLIASRTSAAFR